MELDPTADERRRDQIGLDQMTENIDARDNDDPRMIFKLKGGDDHAGEQSGDRTQIGDKGQDACGRAMMMPKSRPARLSATE